MSPSELVRNNTVPRGQQSEGANGGGFASASWADAGPEVGGRMVPEATASPTIAWEPGGGDYLSNGAAEGAFEKVYVRRTADEKTDTYVIDVEQQVDFLSLAPADIADKERWLELHRKPIEEFFTGRYRANVELLDDDWGNATVTTSVEHEGALTEQLAYDLAREEMKADLLYAEYDNGTNSTENLDRLLREHCDKYVAVETHPEAHDLYGDDIDEEVAERLGHGELRDVTALAIAGALANVGHQEMKRLVETGLGNRETLRDELRRFYIRGFTPRIENRMNMLGTWIINGGDNR